MIHYHGTPITPHEQLHRMAGRHFCVSFSQPQCLRICLQIGQSVLFDNGAFNTHRSGIAYNADGFARWLEPILAHPHFAVVPDVIGGDVEEQRWRVAAWRFGRDLGAPVFHIALPLAYLFELLDAGWWRICLGSSGEFWQVGAPAWCARMDAIFNALERAGARPWIHGLRMLDQTEGGWPLASADSTNVAQNFKRDTGCAECKAVPLDAQQTAPRWFARPEQGELL